eukprot:64904-Pyramimonas_sp.AAC.1
MSTLSLTHHVISSSSSSSKLSASRFSSNVAHPHPHPPHPPHPPPHRPPPPHPIFLLGLVPRIFLISILTLSSYLPPLSPPRSSLDPLARLGAILPQPHPPRQPAAPGSSPRAPRAAGFGWRQEASGEDGEAIRPGRVEHWLAFYVVDHGHGGSEGE